MYYRRLGRKPKLKKVRKRITEIAAEHKLQRMATLTLDPKKLSATDRKRTDRYIRELWRSIDGAIGMLGTIGLGYFAADKLKSAQQAQ